LSGCFTDVLDFYDSESGLWPLRYIKGTNIPSEGSTGDGRPQADPAEPLNVFLHGILRYPFVPIRDMCVNVTRNVARPSSGSVNGTASHTARWRNMYHTDQPAHAETAWFKGPTIDGSAHSGSDSDDSKRAGHLMDTSSKSTVGSRSKISHRALNRSH
jgi:hypothetical protein